MATAILDESYLFTCDKAQSPLAYIKVITNNDKFKHNGRKIIFSNSTMLITATPNFCLLKPISPGNFSPCTPTIISWLNTDKTVKMNNISSLNENSYCMCVSGGVIKPFKNLTNNLSSANIIAGSVGIAGFISQQVAKTSTDNNSVQASSVIASSTTSTSNLSANSNNPIENATSDDKSTPEKPYTICEYDDCDRRDDCDYYNTELPLNPENNSINLRENFQTFKTVECNGYYQRENIENEKLIRERNMSISNQAHHLISGNQALGMKDNGDYYFGELIKLANYCNYDINNALNCILLPSEDRDNKLKGTSQTPKYDVMSIMQAQYHLGGHQFTLDKDTHDKLVEYYHSNLGEFTQLSDSPSSNFFDHYKNAVKTDLDKLKKKYNKRACVANEQFKKQFIKDMDDVSIKIKKYLDNFKTNPKKSFPYFVSKVTVEYAFNLPQTAKIIAIFNGDNNIIANKYRLERYLKNDNKVLATITGTHIIDSNDKDFINFCENIQYFFISNNYILPFNTVVIPTFISRDINADNANIDNNINQILKFVGDNETPYQAIARVITTRLSD